MKKRVLAVVLVFCMTVLLCVPALAVSASVSSQSVKVDGKSVTVQPYNISGNNYFKLRDVAALLNGTGSQFEVSFSNSAKRVGVTTGKSYTSVGGELSVASAGYTSCTVSPWSLYVNGKAVSCSIYIIGGNNYFKLRDLGEAIGFGVDYDTSARTVLVATGGSAAAWSPDITFTTTSLGGDSWTDACFKDHKLTMINYWAYWCGPCVGEMPDLQKLSENYASKGLQVMGVSDGESAKNLASAKDSGVTYPCLNYVSAFDSWLDSGYVPTTVFVDGEGHVVGEAYIGARSYSDWAAIVDGLLA